MIKEQINKFLDSYVGDGVNVKISPRGYYSVYSNNKTLILSFKIFSARDAIKMYRGEQLCGTVSKFFTITEEESMRYIRNWFADKHQMDKVKDLLKFIV